MHARAAPRYRQVHTRTRWVGTKRTDATVAVSAIAALVGLDSVTVVVSRSLLVMPRTIRRVTLRN